jgi:hypothetical protein
MLYQFKLGVKGETERTKHHLQLRGVAEKTNRLMVIGYPLDATDLAPSGQ